ncbi:MAG: ribosome-binding factor A [Halieaceae bacterium]|nr:ribosome-binding factor A [Halieaceae bacterium]|tara:strand:- start:731 stop:1138 length:408 start_codon:yes stop_codon:yes gene_type:complete
MGREFERTQRVSHFLHEELARLLQSTVRDPRVQEVNLTGVEVSRDLSHAKVFFTLMSDASREERAEVTAVLSKVSGFLRSELAKASTMRTVPRISFRFDESVGRGRDMETLLREVRWADEQLHRGDSEDASDTAD